MTGALPLGHEPFGRELRVERLEVEWRFRIYMKEMLFSKASFLGESANTLVTRGITLELIQRAQRLAMILVPVFWRHSLEDRFPLA